MNSPKKNLALIERYQEGNVMATAEQLKSLIRSHFGDDPERFFTLALQVAAHEAQQGHGALAHDIRDIIDKARREKSPKLLKFPKELQGLVLLEKPEIPKASLVAPTGLIGRIERIIYEHRQGGKLKSHGLSPRRKILLVGPPGTGKTMTTRVLGHELGLNFYTVQVDKLVTKFMGETSAKLRQIFDLIQEEPGIYFFDEFDAIGGERTLENDIGEMRRVLNSFLQFIEQDSSDSIIVAATNSPKLLDRALFRRFDDLLYYELPQEMDRRRLMENLLAAFLPNRFVWKDVLAKSEGLSHAEIDNACRDAIKETVLADKKEINTQVILKMLDERQSIHRELNLSLKKLF